MKTIWVVEEYNEIKLTSWLPIYLCETEEAAIDTAENYEMLWKEEGIKYRVKKYIRAD